MEITIVVTPEDVIMLGKKHVRPVTHTSALRAINEVIDYEAIEIQKGRLRESILSTALDRARALDSKPATDSEESTHILIAMPRELWRENVGGASKGLLGKLCAESYEQSLDEETYQKFKEAKDFKAALNTKE